MFSYARALTYIFLASALFSTPLLTVTSADAAESTSASFRNTRSDVNAGGRRKTSATYREDGTTGSLALTTATSAGYRGRDGLQAGYHYPNRVTDLWSSSTSASSQIYLQWTTPGNDGLELNTPGAYVVRYSSLAAESPAISDAKFNAATVVTPTPPAAAVTGSRLTMTVTGLTGGVTYYFAIKTAERDGTRSALSAGATAQTLPPFGCFITRNVHKVDGPYFTIQSAVDSLPQSLNGHACVIVRDGGVYPEQVTVRNFVNNGSSITIAADPASGLQPFVRPPATSTAGFHIANASVNVYGIDVVGINAVPYGIYASSTQVRISSVVVSTSGSAGFYTAGVRVSSWSLVDFTSVTAWNAQGLWLDGSTMTLVMHSTFSARNVAANAVHFNGASSNTFIAVVASNSIGTAYRFDENARNNTVSLSTGYAAADAAFFFGASSNTFSRSYLESGGARGVYLTLNSNYTRIEGSTVVAASDALALSGASSTTVTGSVIRSVGTYGVNVDAASVANTFTASTITSSGAGNAAFVLNGASNVVTGCYVSDVASNAIGLMLNGGVLNRVLNTTVVGNNRGLYLNNASSNTVSGVFVIGQGNVPALSFETSGVNNVIAFTTVTNTGGGVGLAFDSVSTNTVFNTYVQASTAVTVNRSTGVALIDSDFAFTNGNGAGVALGLGNVNFTLSSSTVSGTLSGGTMGKAVWLDRANRGLLAFSSNTLGGAHYGLFVATQTAGADVRIVSNTVVMSLSNSANTYGLAFDGLLTGATVQDNTVVLRAAGTANYAYGLHAESSAGLYVTRNRFSNPGMVTAGSIESIRLSDADNTLLRYNDVHSTGTALTNAYLLRVTSAATGVQVVGNVFSSSFSFATTGSSATLAVSANSQTGFLSDFNTLFSSNSALSFEWGAAPFQGLAAWRAASGDDAGSQSSHPQWFNPSAGVEDFHPRSTAGRFNPLTQAFVNDGTDSPTIDAGDPTSDYSLEPAPNGGRLNQGSYGNTAEASRTGNTGFPGCVVTRNVGAGQTYATIGAGVAALPSTLTGHSCVVIRDAATYAEQVTVENFTNNGSSISIFTDPGVGSRAVVDPPATSTAAFFVKNASVNVYGIDVKPTVEPVTYGVYASSSYVRVSSMNVDSGGSIWRAGVAVSSWSAVSYASVTVQSAHGIWLQGSYMTSVSYSTAINNGTAYNAVYLQGASSSSFNASYARNAAGYGVMIELGMSNVVSRSTAATGNTWTALYLDDSSSNTITGSYMNGGSGDALYLWGVSNWNVVSHSTMTNAAAGNYAAFIRSSSNTISYSFIHNSLGTAMEIWTETGNLIADSTMTSLGAGYSPALNFVSASSNTVTRSYIANPNGLGLSLDTAEYTSISYSTAVGGGGWYALYFNGGSSNTVTRSNLYAVGNAAALGVEDWNSSAYDSTLLSDDSDYATLDLWQGSWNTFARVNVLNASGVAVRLAGGAAPVGNLLTQSTVTSQAAGLVALQFVNTSTNTVENSYVQGSTAALISRSTGTVLRGMVFVATNTAGSALVFDAGVNLTLATSTLMAPSLGRGLWLSTASAGVVSLGSVTVTGAARGLQVSTQAANFTLAVDSITFRSLASGATAIHYLGGAHVSTITLAGFEDASIGANVGASALDLASRVTMRAYSGLRAGPAYENDPNSLVDWGAGPTNVAVVARRPPPAPA